MGVVRLIQVLWIEHRMRQLIHIYNNIDEHEMDNYGREMAIQQAIFEMDAYECKLRKIRNKMTN